MIPWWWPLAAASLPPAVQVWYLSATGLQNSGLQVGANLSVLGGGGGAAAAQPSNQLSSATGDFSKAWVGKSLVINGGGPGPSAQPGQAGRQAGSARPTGAARPVGGRSTTTVSSPRVFSTRCQA